MNNQFTFIKEDILFAYKTTQIETDTIEIQLYKTSDKTYKLTLNEWDKLTIELDKIDYKQSAQKWYDKALTHNTNIVTYTDKYNDKLPIYMLFENKENTLKYLQYVMLHTVAREYLEK